LLALSAIFYGLSDPANTHNTITNSHPHPPAQRQQLTAHGSPVTKLNSVQSVEVPVSFPDICFPVSFGKSVVNFSSCFLRLFVTKQISEIREICG
jgi:hypothetical protein